MQLDRHFHAIHENSFLSGNINLTDNDTTTDFHIPYLGLACVQNSKGRMVMFPSSLPHSVEKLEDDERYSLAYDIITEDGMNYFKEHNTNKDDPLNLAVEL